MSNKIPHIYRTQLLLSITLAIVLIALKTERSTLNLMLVILASILGTFVLDLDYVIHAFFVDPTAQFSTMVRDYVGHKDFKGLFRFIHIHKDDIQDKTLNSALFQVVLGGATLFVLSSSVNLFIRVLVISTFINSIYRFVEVYLNGNVKNWFWSLKVKQTREAMYGYTLVLIVTLLYSLYLF